MNYLSHYFLDRHETDPHFTLGAILPDLMRSFDRRARLRPLPLGYGDERRLALERGIARHCAVDAAFHNTSFFQAQSHALFELLRDWPLAAITRYRNFVAHVTLEIALDHLLLHDYPGLGKQFYCGLSQVDPDVVVAALTDRGVPDAARFPEHLRRFIEASFVARYRDAHSCARVLVHLYERTVQRPAQPDLVSLTRYFGRSAQALRHYEEAFDQTLQQLQQHNFNIGVILTV